MSGIQSLLKTEKQAQEIVAEARSYRAQKLKAAKVDASSEINTYKQKKEAELKAFEDEFSGSNKKLEEEADASVVLELQKIKKTASEKTKDVVKLLIEAVTNPVPELHINATPKE